MPLFKEKTVGHERYEFVHTRNGVRQPIWNENKIGIWLRKRLGYEFAERFLRGRWAFGFWALQLDRRNLVTYSGLANAAGVLVGLVGPVNTLAVGTGTTTAADGDTDLETEITDSGFERAVDSSPTRETTAQTNDTGVITKTWTATGAKAITEAGAFPEDSGADIFSRQTFLAVNQAIGDQFTSTWKYQATTS